jgi:hypothetical protein
MAGKKSGNKQTKHVFNGFDSLKNVDLDDWLQYDPQTKRRQADTGVEVRTVLQSRLFTYEFRRDDLQELIQIMQPLANDTTKPTRDIALEQIEVKLRQMEAQGISSVECMIYATKVLNKRLTSDYRLSQAIGKLVADVVLLDRQRNVPSLYHIIRHWSWTAQVAIAVRASGSVRDLELLKEIYGSYRNVPSMKKALAEAMLESGHDEIIEPIVELVARLDDRIKTDKEVASIVEKNFLTKFGARGYKYVENYVYIEKQATGYGKRVLQRICVPQDGPQQGQDYWNQLANSVGDSITKNDVKEKHFQLLLEALESKEYQSFVIRCIAYTKRPEAGKRLYHLLFEQRFVSQDVERALLAAAKLGEQNVVVLLDHQYANINPAINLGVKTILRYKGAREQLASLLFSKGMVDQKTFLYLLRDKDIREFLLPIVEQQLIESFDKEPESEICARLVLAQTFYNANLKQMRFPKLFVAMSARLRAARGSETMLNTLMSFANMIAGNEDFKEWLDTLFMLIDHPGLPVMIRSNASQILKRLEKQRPGA